MNCNLESLPQRAALKLRIDEYLIGRHLITILGHAIDGIGKCMTILHERPGELSLLPNLRRELQQETVEHLYQTLEDLRKSLVKLLDTGLKWRSARTGIGAEPLHAMARFLGQNIDVNTDRALFDGLIEQVFATPDREEFHRDKPSLESAIVEIIAAFVPLKR